MNARHFDMNSVGGFQKIARSAPRRYSDDQSRDTKKANRDNRQQANHKRAHISS